MPPGGQPLPPGDRPSQTRCSGDPGLPHQPSTHLASYSPGPRPGSQLLMLGWSWLTVRLIYLAGS